MKRSGFLKRTGRLNPVSERTFDKQRKRRAIVAAVLKARPWCACCLVARATDPHEPWSRGRGGPIDDPNAIMGVCRECHGWIHGHPREAARRGLLVSAADGPAWLEKGGVNQ